MPPRISINGPSSQGVLPLESARPSVPLTGSNDSPDHSPINSANFSDMAPIRNNTHGIDRGDSEVQSGRKMRKPLVEKKRRARINESLQELRLLVADADLQSKMENAEVLEVTVKRVESILQNRDREVDAVNREERERFAAGYIQCMHDVHTFVSSCPEIEPAVAAELLNHLLESMPLNDEDRVQLMLPDNYSTCPRSESSFTALVSPAPSSPSTEDLSSDLDDLDSEQSQVSSSEEADNQDVLPGYNFSKLVWRPW